MRRLSGQSFLLALRTQEGYVDFYVNFQHTFSSRTLVDFNSQATNYNNGSSSPFRKSVKNAVRKKLGAIAKDDYSRVEWLFVGTEQIYFGSFQNRTYRTPIDRDSASFDIRKAREVDDYMMELLNENFVHQHVSIFRDFKVFNGICMFAHGQVVSIFDMSSS